MTDGIDIDWIVREVVGRLHEQPAGEFERCSAVQPNSTCGTTGGELKLDDQIVTLATLDGRLSQVLRVVVRQRAIVTPAARDLLKAKNVALQRGNYDEPKPAPAVLGKLQVIVAAAGLDMRALAKLLGGDIPVIDWASQTAEALKQAIACAASGGRAALLTDAPAAAVMQANRNPAVRGALGYSFPAIRHAIEQINANLLVLEPAGRNITELGGMIGEFFRSR